MFTKTDRNTEIVALHSSTTKILSNFYKKNAEVNNKAATQQTEEEKKEAILKAAAALLKNDIKKIPGKETQYNLFETLSSQETAMEFIPNSMRTFLSCLLVGNEKVKKIAAIGQAIIQAIRPRTILAPLQLGLELQVHHLHSSKNLINILSSFGYCVPYNEVILFEKNAAPK